jgi:hypothetical protein
MLLSKVCCDGEIVASAKTAGKEKPHQSVGFLQRRT